MTQPRMNNLSLTDFSRASGITYQMAGRLLKAGFIPSLANGQIPLTEEVMHLSAQLAADTSDLQLVEMTPIQRAAVDMYDIKGRLRSEGVMHGKHVDRLRREDIEPIFTDLEPSRGDSMEFPLDHVELDVAPEHNTFIDGSVFETDYETPLPEAPVDDAPEDVNVGDEPVTMAEFVSCVIQKLQDETVPVNLETYVQMSDLVTQLRPLRRAVRRYRRRIRRLL